MKRICKTCKTEFEGEKWMRQCRDCYKNFRNQKRINTTGDETTRGVVILSHPSCTKEEIDEYIEKRFGSVNTPENWGAVEITGKNRKVWWNCQNDN